MNRHRIIQTAFGGRLTHIRTIHGVEIGWTFPSEGAFRAYRRWVYKTAAQRTARRKAQRAARRRNRVGA